MVWKERGGWTLRLTKGLIVAGVEAEIQKAISEKRRLRKEFRIVLPDGTIRWSTDKVSPANHDSADKFLAETARLAGGATTRVAKKGTPHHHQGVEHVHQ